MTKEERREYCKQWMRKRRQAFFDGKVCVSCGSTNDLELDHIDPSTKVHHCIWSWSEERRNIELAKCQVLCSSCHKKKTFKDLYSNFPKHGTPTTYRKGCRCLICKTAGTLDRRKYKRNR